MRLRTVPDAGLHRPVTPLDLVGAERWPRHELGRIIMGMLDTMYRHDGVGLAAPQVGVDAQILVADPHQDRHQALVCINPVIVALGADTVVMTEGCLSVPGVTRAIARPDTITIRYYDAECFPQELAADGWLARILQHEIDHLHGRLLTDHPVAP